MPLAKSFDGGFTFCQATGYEVNIDSEWWNEYVDEHGEFH